MYLLRHAAELSRNTCGVGCCFTAIETGVLEQYNKVFEYKRTGHWAICVYCDCRVATAAVLGSGAETDELQSAAFRLRRRAIW